MLKKIINDVVLVLRIGEVAGNIPSKLVLDVIFPMVSCPSPYGSFILFIYLFLFMLKVLYKRT